MMTKHGLALPNLGNAYPVYTGSNSLSPFHECYANRNTILRLAAGRFFLSITMEKTSSKRTGRCEIELPFLMFLKDPSR